MWEVSPSSHLCVLADADTCHRRCGIGHKGTPASLRHCIHHADGKARKSLRDVRQVPGDARADPPGSDTAGLGATAPAREPGTSVPLRLRTSTHRDIPIQDAKRLIWNGIRHTTAMWLGTTPVAKNSAMRLVWRATAASSIDATICWPCPVPSRSTRAARMAGMVRAEVVRSMKPMLRKLSPLLPTEPFRLAKPEKPGCMYLSRAQCQWPVWTKAGEGAIYQAGIPSRQRLITQAETLDDSNAEILDKHIGTLCQTIGTLEIGRIFEV